MNTVTVGWRAAGILSILLGVAGHGAALGFTGQETLVTVAGGGGVGDGGPPAKARLSAPGGIALDGAGNLYIADTGHHRIRKLSADGSVTTVAGTGVAGFGGDGGSALQANLADPTGIAVDGDGNLYIADSGNHRVRKVDGQGLIGTVAGTGTAGFSGDGAAASGARLDEPKGLAIAGGFLYIADSANHRVRRVDGQGTITSFAGTGTAGHSGDGGPAAQAQLDHPVGLVADGGGIVIADRSRWRDASSCNPTTTCNQQTLASIRRVDADGVISTVAGGGCEYLWYLGAQGHLADCSYGDGGKAAEATLRAPVAVARDVAGNLYVADAESHRIRRIGADAAISALAGGLYCIYYDNSRLYEEHGCFGGDGGAAPAARLSSPSALAVDGSGNLYVADTGNDRIRRIDSTGLITTVAGGDIGDGGPAPQAILAVPADVAVDAAGRVYIADTGHGRVRRVGLSGTIETVAGDGSGGADTGDGGSAMRAALHAPRSVAVGSLGTLYIADAPQHRVRRVQVGGVISTVAGGVFCDLYRSTSVPCAPEDGTAATASLNFPSGVAPDAGGGLFIADTGFHRVRRVDPAGAGLVTVAGVAVDEQAPGFSGDGSAATAAELNRPAAAVAANDSWYLVDTDNNRIRKITADGLIDTVAGGGSPADGLGDGGAATAAALGGPVDLAVDGLGNVFIADRGHRRVRQVDAAGVISTVAGGGAEVGDGVASGIDLDPSGLALDGAGNLYVADAGHGRIRRLGSEVPDKPVLLVGRGGAGRVASRPSRIDCGSDCAGSFARGARVVLRAVPAAGYRFAGWSGDCSGRRGCVLKMAETHVVEALFEPKPDRLELAVAVTGAGQVRSRPAGIRCGRRCQAAFRAGSRVTLVARPDRGSVLVDWSGECAGQKVCKLTLEAAQTVTARFAPAP